jgi:hypothetical protein
MTFLSPLRALFAGRIAIHTGATLASAVCSLTPLAEGAQVVIEARFFEMTPETAPALAELTRVDGVGLASGTGGAVAGVFTSEQAANALRALTATRGVDLLAAPRVVTGSGQRASIEIAREFRHPVEWKRDAIGAWEAERFETKNLGISFGVEAKVNGDGTLDLVLEPEVVELAGFQDLDAPGQPMKTVPEAGQSLTRRMLEPKVDELLPAGHRGRAAFHTRKLATSLTVWAGQSVLLELVDPPRGAPAARRLFALVAADVVEAEPAQAAPAAPEPKDARVEKLNQIIVPKLELNDATVRDAVEFLTKKFEELHPDRHGVSVVMKLPPGDMTVLTVTLENVPFFNALKYVANLAGLEIEIERQAIVLRPPADKRPAFVEPPAGSPEARLLARARGMRLPAVVFKDARVAEAAEFLRRKSAEHDIEKKGVNVVVTAVGKGPETLLTLDLKDVSVAEALTYVAELAGFRLEVGPSAFLLRPRGE